MQQRTLRTSISATGVGLHSGQIANLQLRPAPVDTGIIFKRTDLPDSAPVKATAYSVCDTLFCTTLGQDDVRIVTVEHLLSAMSGLGIDNAYVDISAAEVPIMDGSASPFIFLLQSAGIAEQPATKRFIRIRKKIEVEDNGCYACLEPYDGFKVTFAIEYKHPVVKAYPQNFSIDLTSSSYTKEVSRARTYGFMSDYEKLLANNLALGGSLDNAVVVDEDRILNVDGLRSADEFVKHKVLDAIGDLYLLGPNIMGAFTGRKSGHTLNHKLVCKVLADADAWEDVESLSAVACA